jgi:hypothetical protein
LKVEIRKVAAEKLTSVCTVLKKLGFSYATDSDSAFYIITCQFKALVRSDSAYQLALFIYTSLT